MTPRRVLLRIKKLRRFLDERIGDAARDREGADGAEARAEAAGRLAAYQEVRGEMIGERLDADAIEPVAEEDGGKAEESAEEAGESDPEGAGASAAAGEEEASAGG